MCKSRYLLLLLKLVLIDSKTVRYSLTPQETVSENYNNAYFTTKSYELQVPGSDPIKIIEADQPERPRQLDLRKYKFGDKLQDFFTTQQTKTTLSEPVTNKCFGISCAPYEIGEDDSEGGSKLNDFIKKFADRYSDVKEDFKEPIMEKVDLIEPIQEQSKMFNDVQEKGYNNRPQNLPQEDGWVTLEAVPWSTSKVSKWHSNAKPNRWPDVGESKPTWFNRPYDPPNYDVRPAYRPVYNKVDDKYDKYESQDWSLDLPSRPSWEQDYQQSGSSYYDKVGTPHKHYDNKDCNKNHNDLITDGRPGNFPTQPLGFAPYSDTYRRPTSVVYADLVSANRPTLISEQRHPVTHPTSGDGQWVLLSTTKGYQYPKNRQRSLEINPAVLSARKSVRLTVLPALNGSDVNMTTSHGGLLQVDAAFESVDDARKSYIRKLKFNGTGIRKRHRIKVNAQPQPVSNAPDATAVLAAVGAGMVPATMAMVMPMVLGRKRRSIDNYKVFGQKRRDIENPTDFVLTHLPGYQLEPTVQQNLM